MHTHCIKPLTCYLLIVVACVPIALSIRCWHCNSDSDPKCADPFDNSTIYMKDCDKEPELEHYPGVKATMCRKIRQKVNGKWRYYRNCAYLGEPGIGGDERYCLMRTGTYNIFSEYCTCRGKDGCNTSSSHKYTLTTTIMAIFITYLQQHLRLLYAV